MKEETEFKLPKNWHVVVTKENQHVLSGWRETIGGYLVPVNNIVGMTMGDKGHNGRNEIKDTSVPCVYDFGQEITFKQFKKYVLKEEIKTFPRKMFCWDGDNKAGAIIDMVHAILPDRQSLNKVISSSFIYEFAEEITTKELIHLSFQDISDGKGVGVDPELIRIKKQGYELIHLFNIKDTYN